MKFITVSSIALLMTASQVLAKPIAGCLETYVVTATDSCTSVATKFSIAEADFYTMNPGLHHSVQHDCDNLDTGKPFCVCVTEPCAPGGDLKGTSGFNSSSSSAAVVSNSAAKPSSVALAALAASVSSARPSTAVGTASAASIKASSSALASALASASGSSSASSSASASASSQVAKSNAAPLVATFGVIAVSVILATTSTLI